MAKRKYTDRVYRAKYTDKSGQDRYKYRVGDTYFDSNEEATAHFDSLAAEDQRIKQEKELKKLDTNLGLISKYEKKLENDTNITPPEEGELDERTPQQKQLYNIYKNRLDILYAGVGILPDVQPEDDIAATKIPDKPTEAWYYSQSGVDRKKVRDRIAAEVNEVFKGTKVSIKEFLKLTNKELGTNYKSMNEYIDALTDSEIESSIKPKDKSTEELLKEIE